MKTIGLLGGMSWESTTLYYRLINEAVRDRLGGLHSAKVALVSVDFAPIDELQRRADWEAAGTLLGREAAHVQRAGADLLLLCTNTMHKVAPQIEAAIDIPLLHIADAAGERIRAAGIDSVGVLGTRFTMEEQFYTGRLADTFGLSVVVPEQEEREEIHRVIYEELVLGETRDASRTYLLRVIDSLRGRGAQGVVLGCTEIPLLVGPSDASLPVFDTTRIHAQRAVELALQGADSGAD